MEDVWRLQPALCAPLVARWFFTSPVRRPWATLVDAFPDHSLNLASAVMSAVEVSPSSLARAQAEKWIHSLSAPTSWDVSTFAVVAQYARLDTRAAQFAVNGALAVLATPREPEELYGVLVDLLGDAATRQLIQSARQFLLPEAIEGLLTLAVGDRRRRNSTPDHPLRVLSDLAGVIDPDFGTSLEIRARLLRAVLGWMRRHRASGEQWSVATETPAVGERLREGPRRRDAPGPAPLTDTPTHRRRSLPPLAHAAAKPEPARPEPETVPAYLADAGDHDALLDAFIDSHSEGEKWQAIPIESAC